MTYKPPSDFNVPCRWSDQQKLRFLVLKYFPHAVINYIFPYNVYVVITFWGCLWTIITLHTVKRVSTRPLGACVFNLQFLFAINWPIIANMHRAHIDPPSICTILLLGSEFISILVKTVYVDLCIRLCTQKYTGFIIWKIHYASTLSN